MLTYLVTYQGILPRPPTAIHNGEHTVVIYHLLRERNAFIEHLLQGMQLLEKNGLKCERKSDTESDRYKDAVKRME